MVIGNPMIFRQLPIEDALAKIVELGYNGVELWAPQVKSCKTPDLRRRLSKYVMSLGLKPVRVNAADADYFNMLTAPRDVPNIVAGLSSEIDAASDLGMPQLLTWEGRKPQSATPKDVYGWILDETVSIFEQALDHACQRAVSLSIEVHPFTLGMDLDWLILLCDRLNSPQFGVVYDCCHFGVGLPDGYIDAIYKLGSRIRHVHFSDSDKVSSELHFAPGTGCLDLGGIVSALKRVGFNGTVMLDLWQYPLPEEGSRIGVPYVAKILKELALD